MTLPTFTSFTQGFGIALVAFQLLFRCLGIKVITFGLFLGMDGDE